MSDYWSGKSVVVTGASGFLGKRLAHALVDRGAMVRFITSRKLYDLRDPFQTSDAIYRHQTGNVLFHLAADVGGIGDNISRPAEIFYNNVMMNTNVINEAVRERYDKVIALGSSCAYPSDAPLPFVESDYLRGEPEPTNAPYAYSKRLLLSHLQAAHTQYGLNYTYLILANLYGEGCDTNPDTAHVIGALVRKFIDAERNGDKEITVWGTGKSTRDFLHISDAVQSLLKAGEHEAMNEAINIGSGEEINIAFIAYKLRDYLQNHGTHIEIKWDITKPDGQTRRLLDMRNANSLLEYWPAKDFVKGLRQTVDWYTSTQRELSPA